MGHRKFKHTDFGDFNAPPFRYVSKQEKKQDHGPWWTWVVTRILAGTLFMTMLAFFAFEAYYKHFLR
jgi:hypothetical protein